MDARAGDATDLSFDQLMELDRRAAAQVADSGPSSDDAGSADDTEIVLPWWQHPVNILTLIVTAAVMAGMIGWMVGDSGADIRHNDVDTGFLQDMRVHHEQAVQMSFIYRTRPDIDPGLRTIADTIIVGQSMEIGRMVQLLRDLGESEINEAEASMLWMGMSAAPDDMPGMATGEELDRLATLDGAAADELFVALMTDHHLGGIDMAEFAIENAESDEVIAMAEGMAGGQRGEIVEMRERLD